MGKPYSSELAVLASTYNFVAEADIADLVMAIRSHLHMPLYAVGSGGSLTAAYFAAYIHQTCTGQMAKAITPLEAIGSRFSQAGAIIITAGGRNRDINSAFDAIVKAEPGACTILTSTKRSPLITSASEHRSIGTYCLPLPSGKDGFLATNSLLAFCLLLVRSYSVALDLHLAIPGTYSQLLPTSLRDNPPPACIWQREHLVVLHGIDTQPAAVDFESKLTEAGLSGVRLADYRNFGHGRHHWLAKHAETSAVIAICSKQDTQLAQRTLRLLPANIPSATIGVPHIGPASALAAVAMVIEAVELAGRARSIDPGRPGVPHFGSRLYRLSPQRPRRDVSIPVAEAVAITRQSGQEIFVLREHGELDLWRKAYRAAVAELAKARFAAVILDYDGTLCDGPDRMKGLATPVCRELTRLISRGIRVAVATGRGGSVREDLQARLPRRLWKRTLVGYYNGAEVAPLDDDTHPVHGKLTPPLQTVLDKLSESTLFNTLCEVTSRPLQITLRPKASVAPKRLWELVHHEIFRIGVQGVSVWTSGHSIDLLAPGVSKTNVLAAVRTALSGANADVLCIGDRPSWPGNDYSLLNAPCSVSVDEVPLSQGRSWNLAPPGYRGSEAAQFYLRCLTVRHGLASLKFTSAETVR